MDRRQWGAIMLVVLVAGATDSFAQSQLSADQRRWLDESCHRSLGPSLWTACMTRETSALLSSSPNLASLTVSARQWIAELSPVVGSKSLLELHSARVQCGSDAGLA